MNLYVLAIFHTVSGADVYFVDDTIGWVGLHNYRNQSILAPGAQHDDVQNSGFIRLIFHRRGHGRCLLRDRIRCQAYFKSVFVGYAFGTRLLEAMTFNIHFATILHGDLCYTFIPGWS